MRRRGGTPDIDSLENLKDVKRRESGEGFAFFLRGKQEGNQRGVTGFVVVPGVVRDIRERGPGARRQPKTLRL